MRGAARGEWYGVRFENDDAVRDFVREHPLGAERGEVAQFFGLSNERIRNLEESALAKLREALGAEPAPKAPAWERTRRRIRKLIAEGVKAAAIADRVGVPISRVYRQKTIMNKEAA